jgi:mRNA-degrading endonuclease RelE of RelBE toxin-antitoxin system
VAKKARPRGTPPSPKTAKVVSPGQPYTVSMTATAKATYIALRQSALDAEAKGNTSSAHIKTFRIVDDAIRRTIPADPVNTKFALHKPLNNFFRAAKGRLRIVWAVSVEHREVLIVFISDTPRKEGDSHDPYVILTAMKKAGFLTSIVEDWQRALAVPPGSRIH